MEDEVGAEDRSEPSRVRGGRSFCKSAILDLCGVKRRSGDLTGRGGVGRAESRGGRGGAAGSIVKPGDFRSGRGEVCDIGVGVTGIGRSVSLDSGIA
jgi:hypothetical protein